MSTSFLYDIIIQRVLSDLLQPIKLRNLKLLDNPQPIIHVYKDKQILNTKHSLQIKYPKGLNNMANKRMTAISLNIQFIVNDYLMAIVDFF